MDKAYISRLENAIKQMLSPLKDVPLNLVLESLSGCKVIPFDPLDSRDNEVLETLKKVASTTGSNVNKKGILRTRPNEVGNDIEPFVRNALNSLAFPAGIPIAASGDRKAMGYPDIEFVDGFGRVNYLECKTYNIENVGTSQRSFYLSPSENFKVTKDAHHFILSFETFVAGRKKGLNCYKCRSWKILSAEKITVDVKHEFNCDNARLYQPGNLLAAGKVPV